MNISSLKITASSVVKTIVSTAGNVLRNASVDGFWSVGKTPMSRMTYNSFSDSTKLPSFDMIGVPPFVMIVSKETKTP